VSSDPDKTPRNGLDPDELIPHVREVREKAREKAKRLERMAAQAELLEVSLNGWRTSVTTDRDRGRDMQDVFDLREAARKEGVIE
jgi:hypothetical protein